MNLDSDHPLTPSTVICQNFNKVWEISCSWCTPTTESEGPRCFFEQETLPLLLSTGLFQELIRA